MNRPRRVLVRDLAMVLVWTAVAVLAGAATWSAVSGMGQGGSALSSGRPLGRGDVMRALREAPAQQPRAGTPVGSDQPPGRSRTRSWRVVGGTVAASCRGAAVDLMYAAPADGWSYRLGTSTREVLSVEFSRPTGLSRLVVRCPGGVPTRVLSAVRPAQRTQPVQPVAPADDGSGEGSGD